jgi:hypothetical protein
MENFVQVKGALVKPLKGLFLVLFWSERGCLHSFRMHALDMEVFPIFTLFIFRIEVLFIGLILLV